jgi:hypothetical protein
VPLSRNLKTLTSWNPLGLFRPDLPFLLCLNCCFGGAFLGLLVANWLSFPTNKCVAKVRQAHRHITCRDVLCTHRPHVRFVRKWTFYFKQKHISQIARISTNPLAIKHWVESASYIGSIHTTQRTQTANIRKTKL